MNDDHSLISDINIRFNKSIISDTQTAADGILTIWVHGDQIKDLLRYLKNELNQPFRMLYDLTAIDERRRINQPKKPDHDFTIVYHLTSLDRNSDIRIKVPLKGEYPAIVSITDIWESANWYECEIFDMFGITFICHPHLRRLLMPKSWVGHPLRKEYPARATELGAYALDEQMREIADNDLKFDPVEWGLKTHSRDTDFMFLNLGPQHPGLTGRNPPYPILPGCMTGSPTDCPK